MQCCLSIALLLSALGLGMTGSFNCSGTNNEYDDQCGRVEGDKTMLQVRMQDNEVIEAREANNSLEDSRLKFVVLDEHSGVPAKNVAQDGHALQIQLQDHRQEQLASAPENSKSAVQMEHPQTQGSDVARLFAGKLRSASLERITRSFYQRVNIFIAGHRERIEQVGAWVVIITAIITSVVICGCYSWNIRRSDSQRATFQPARAFLPRTTSLPSGSMDAALGVVPLCPHLVVPDKKRLSCIVQSSLRREKQDLTFAIQNTQRLPVFQVVVSELSEANKPGIFLKSSNGSTMHGFISTRELWNGSTSPILNIYDAAGELHSTLQKNTYDADSYYELIREQNTYMRLNGDFQHNSFSVFLPRGPPTEYQPHDQIVAIAQPIDLGLYSLKVHAHVDASIVILSMLAVNKLENYQPDSHATASS